jgi:hypothetical protein
LHATTKSSALRINARIGGAARELGESAAGRYVATILGAQVVVEARDLAVQATLDRIASGVVASGYARACDGKVLAPERRVATVLGAIAVIIAGYRSGNAVARRRIASYRVAHIGGGASRINVNATTLVRGKGHSA